MNFGVLFEKVTDKEFPSGYYYAHVPSLGLTTHGLGIDGARQAAADLLRLWIAEKRRRVTCRVSTRRRWPSRGAP